MGKMYASFAKQAIEKEFEPIAKIFEDVMKNKKSHEKDTEHYLKILK